MKKKDVLLIIFIFIAVFSIIIVRPIENLDELWNYNTARAVAEGLTPYKDISMITTPLLPIITSVFLKIANEVIMSRILATAIWTSILFLTYKIFRKLIKEENISLISTALIGILFRGIFSLDYNVTLLLIALIIVYQEIEHLENVTQYNKKYDFIIGLLAGLAICTKQSIGIALAGIIVIYKIMFIKNKSQIKEYTKIIITRIIGILIPVLLLITYLIFSGSITDFINYAILGIKTFSNSISYTALLRNDKIEINILSIVVPITILIVIILLILSKKLKIQKKCQEELITLLMYSLSMAIVMYPISDEIHFLIGSLIVYILLVYIVVYVAQIIYNKIQIRNKLKIYKITSALIWIVLFAIILMNSMKSLNTYFKAEKNTQIEHYKWIQIQDYLEKRINKIDKYILQKEKEGKKVYILDSEAAVYNIPINKYNKNYDMFLKGNIGKDGEDGQIKKIQNKDDNILYLIKRRDLNLNWQIPINVVKYIRENLELVEEISIYEVYK